jgi:hypothetical protein
MAARSSQTLTALPSSTLLRRLVGEFERRGWRDDGETALAIVIEAQRRGRCPSSGALREIVPSSFLAVNSTSRAKVHDACRTAFATKIR